MLPGFFKEPFACIYTRTSFFGDVSVAQLVASMSGVVLG